MHKTIFLPLLVATAALLNGCGGGGGGGSSATPPVTSTPPPTATPAAASYLNLCQAPRTTTGAGAAVPDRQGSLSDELTYLRLWSDETYLWYRELPTTPPAGFATPLAYFNVLKTSAVTASGKPKDNYHFTSPTEQYEESTRGVELGYGLSWAANSAPSFPRVWRVTSVAPGSPAAVAGLRRGDRLVTVDGYDFINGGDSATVDRLNAGLFPAAGERHTFAVARGSDALGSAPTVSSTVTLLAAKVDVPAVQNTKVIDTPTGKVGYLTFDDHNAASERQLIAAFNTLKAAAVDDLVLDMRYNGGGLLVVASQIAYMVAGPGPTSGKTFERLLVNDKRPAEEPMAFRTTSIGLETALPAPARQPLPYLGLKRVTILTGKGTCSASESLVNGLRGVDVEVNLVGDQTCGKPYGFYPQPNCGTTYFTVQFQGVNQKGFGDYADGFAPTCKVADDFSRAQGDPAEGQLAAALRYRSTGQCQAPAAMARSMEPGSASAPAQGLTPVRSPTREIAVYSRH